TTWNLGPEMRVDEVDDCVEIFPDGLGAHLLVVSHHENFLGEGEGGESSRITLGCLVDDEQVELNVLAHEGFIYSLEGTDPYRDSPKSALQCVLGNSQVVQRILSRALSVSLHRVDILVKRATLVVARSLDLRMPRPTLDQLERCRP